MPLTARQKAFIAEYAVDRCAAGAARRAGFSEKTAREIGRQLLKRPEIKAAIQAATQEQEERTGISADRVLQELAAMAIYDPGVIGSANLKGPADIAKLPEAVRRAIVGWSWDRNGNFVLRLSPKTPSLEALGRHFGLFRDRVEHTGRGGGPIETKEITNTDRAKALSALVAKMQAEAETGLG